MASVPGEDRATWSPPAPRSWRRLPLLAWDAPLYVHLPAGDPFDPQRLPETGSGHDRWSRPGQPTIYLASDPAVALAELARHRQPDGEADERRVLRLVTGPKGIGGLVDLPVIAVPTSVGYGASFGGLAALLAMLNSCAAGITVVNVDNGFGAGVAASRINRALPASDV